MLMDKLTSIIKYRLGTKQFILFSTFGDHFYLLGIHVTDKDMIHKQILQLLWISNGYIYDY